MLDLAGEPVLQRSRLQYGQEEDLREPAAIARHLLANYDILESVPDGESYWRSIHFQIAICYFRGFGTTINVERGLQFLASSALGGVRRAMFMFNSFESSSSVRVKEDLPRRLFLLLGYFENCSEAADLLRSRYPDTFAAAQVLHAGCWSFGPGTLVSSIRSDRHEKAYDLVKMEHQAQKQVWEARSTLMGRLARICELGMDEDPWLSILADRMDSDMGKIMFAVALERENMQLFTSLLKLGCDAHVLNPDAGPSPLHILAFIEDACAAELAKVLVDSGVRLDQDAVEPWSNCKNRVSLGRSWPTVWAVVKNRPLLFEALLDIHLAKNITIPKIHAHALAATIARYQRPQMLEALLARQILNREELKDADFLLYALNQGFPQNLDHDLIGLRWALESSFQVGQQAVLRFLLEHEADPLGPSSPGNTVLERCILKGDGPSLEIFSDYLRQKGANLENLLGNTGVCSHLGPWESRSALMASLVARDGSAFRWLLVTFPGSINDRSIWDITLLRRAAEDRHLFWAVELLLRKGADILCYDDMGFSPLATALAMGNMDIAQILVQHAHNHGMLKALLGPNPVNGYNLLGVLLKTFSAGRKRRLDVSSFEYLWKLGGAVFDVHGEDETVWRIFFRKGRSTRVDHRAADIRLLKFLLRSEVFGGLVDSSDWTGRTPLHYACYRGNLDAVVLLLDSGASIDTLSKPGIRERPKLKGGFTPLDFAIVAYSSGAPKEVRAGGAVEVGQWQQRMKSIITELVNRGGHCAPNRDAAHQIYAKKIANPNEWKRVYVGFEDPKGDERWRAEWPKPLPVCPTGTSPMQEQEMMIGEVLNPDTGEMEPQYEPLIIYRDRKGRKHKLTRTALQLVGPFLDESSDEDDDAEIEAFQHELSWIKAYIRKYVSAKAEAERTQEIELVDVQAMLDDIRLGNDEIESNGGERDLTE
jgi:ankyrin repeat protein